MVTSLIASTSGVKNIADPIDAEDIAHHDAPLTAKNAKKPTTVAKRKHTVVMKKVSTTLELKKPSSEVKELRK